MSVERTDGVSVAQVLPSCCSSRPCAQILYAMHTTLFIFYSYRVFCYYLYLFSYYRFLFL